VIRLSMHTLFLWFCLLGLVAAGCGKKEIRTGGAGLSSPGGVVAEVIGVVKRPDKAPNFSWKDNEGRIVEFDAYRGKVTLINFWATWCGPCKRELPDLISLSRELANRNIRFIGVSTDRGPNIIEDVRSFANEQGIPYPIVISNDDLEEAFGNPRAIPTSFLIDADGKIVHTLVGLRTKESLSQEITSLLK
jgi:thiol-disulfide isomerase/thioredoxin